jgi:SsrA-binding protein
MKFTYILFFAHIPILLINGFITPSTSRHTTVGTPKTLVQQPSSRSPITLQAQKKNKKPSNTNPIISTNRQARRNYEIISTFDAGISLLGSEIKAIRDGKMNLRDGYVRPDKVGRGLSLYNVHIGKHTTGDYFNHEERRVRPLLLRSEECRKLRKEVEIKGMTIVPLKAFLNEKNLVKIQIGLCRGKNVRDKRDAIKEREMKRDTDRMMKSFRV